MAGGRLTSLRIERNQLVDQWINKKGPESAKILVRIMDLDEAIDHELEMLRKNNMRKKLNIS
jgi:hypothetical protein